MRLCLLCLVGLVSFAVLQWGSGRPRLGVASAQTPQREGTYVLRQVCKSTPRPNTWQCDDEAKKQARAPELFSLWKLADGKNVYLWGDEYSEYQDEGPDSFLLCASRSRGEITGQGGKYQLKITTPMMSVDRPVKLQYVLEKKDNSRRNPSSSAPPSACRAAGAGTGTYARHDDPLVFPLRAQVTAPSSPAPPTERRVNGQVLLSIRDTKDRPATANDKNAWACLMTKSFPRLLFTQPSAAGSQGRETFVWPDGHFQSVFLPMRVYEWQLSSPDCGVASNSPGRFAVPPPSSGLSASTAEEKLVLGCWVADAKFGNCESWWLTRP